jgi:uncharacterized SAM-binding protein YcdF (DUF218 family)
MFFILSKALYYFITPFSWLMISLILFFFLKNSKWKKISKITFITILLFFSNSMIFMEFERMWEIHGTPIKKMTKKYDVGIVLGGMFEYNSDLQELSCRRGVDRIWQAINLYKAGIIKKIFISGGSGYVTDRGLSEASQAKEVLIKWGIPEKDLIIESISKNTYENAVETKKVLTRSYPHIKKCLLITSGQHMRRSRAIFKKQGFTFDTFSTDLYTGPKRAYYWDQYLVPDAQNISDWSGLIKEWIGYVTYALVGYL